MSYFYNIWDLCWFGAHWTVKNNQKCLLNKIKFIYSEKATKFCKISTLLLSYVVPVKCKVEIWQNCVVFSEYMHFNFRIWKVLQLSFYSSNQNAVTEMSKGNKMKWYLLWCDHNMHYFPVCNIPIPNCRTFFSWKDIKLIMKHHFKSFW